MKSYKKSVITGILIIAALSISTVCYAETAHPTNASVVMNGKRMDFCAYDLYGSNYFKLRDIAAALKDTEKKFNIHWNEWSNQIDLYTSSHKNFKDYELTGTEFSQTANTEQTAMISVPKLTIDDNKTTFVGYNIKNSNYFKIRDLAKFFDFYVGYENGHIVLDITKQYEFETPYEQSGSIIAMAYETDLPLFINEMPMISYYVPCETAYNDEQLKCIQANPVLNSVYINAAELDKYGFDIAEYDGCVWLARNQNKKFGILDGERLNSIPSNVWEVYSEENAVYLDGKKVRSVTINSKPYIAAAELLHYGAVSKNYYIANYSGNVLSKRINIDFMRDELMKRFDTLGEGETVKISPEIDIEEITNYFSNKNYCRGDLLKKNGMWQYAVIYGSTSNKYERYIGEIENDLFHGSGILEFHSANTGAGASSKNTWSFSRGKFEKGILIDGIKTDSPNEMPGSFGTRTEGAMENGYKRNFLLFQGKDERFRFGYRTVSEGTIENGEYCGYYRHYDANGKLIFEGDYADYKQE